MPSLSHLLNRSHLSAFTSSRYYDCGYEVQAREGPLKQRLRRRRDVERLNDQMSQKRFFVKASICL